MERRAVRSADRRRAGAVAPRPGSSALALDHLSKSSLPCAIAGAARGSQKRSCPLHHRNSSVGPIAAGRLCCLISIKSGTGPADRMAVEQSCRLALFSDIHANRQAFSACLDFARARGAERMICLGDYVGYGGDPEWTVGTVMDLVERGAIAVRGNHDSAIAMTTESMNAEAQPAIEWTPRRLIAPQPP